jgi:hypothetical protein
LIDLIVINETEPCDLGISKFKLIFGHYFSKGLIEYCIVQLIFFMTKSAFWEVFLKRRVIKKSYEIKRSIMNFWSESKMSQKVFSEI